MTTQLSPGALVREIRQYLGANVHLSGVEDSMLDDAALELARLACGVVMHRGNAEDRMVAHEEMACPHCGGSGHKDDVQPAAHPNEEIPLPLDYLLGHQHGLEWAARLAEAVDPRTNDWLYDCPHELAKAMRKGPEMPVAAPSAAALDVLAERRRQIESEGWTAEHDDANETGDMARAAACYAIVAADYPADDVAILRFWPWLDTWWKPADRRRNLIKAGALVLAEIERLDRAAARKEAGHA